MPGSSESPDQNEKAPDRIAVESKSDEFGATRWLLPTIDRTQKAFSNSSPVPNEVVLEVVFSEVAHSPGPMQTIPSLAVLGRPERGRAGEALRGLYMMVRLISATTRIAKAQAAMRQTANSTRTHPKAPARGRSLRQAPRRRPVSPPRKPPRGSRRWSCAPLYPRGPGLLPRCTHGQNAWEVILVNFALTEFPEVESGRSVTWADLAKLTLLSPNVGR